MTVKEKAILALLTAPIGMVPACWIVNGWKILVGLFAESFEVEVADPFRIGGLPWFASGSIAG